jgi:hypothetical protein
MRRSALARADRIALERQIMLEAPDHLGTIECEVQSSPIQVEQVAVLVSLKERPQLRSKDLFGFE